MFAYKEVKREKLHHLTDLYFESLTGLYDDYLEDHILGSVHYKMTYEKKEIGYFAVYKKEKLTQFYIVDLYKHLAQGCFKNVLRELNIKTAYVPTADTFFLGLAMDEHKKIELQAYFFKETSRKVAEPAYPKTMLRLASISDAEAIKEKSKGYFDDLYQAISDRQIYILEGEEMYGFGIMVPNRIFREYRGIGMYTIEKFRHRGVGRSIILHLKDLVHTMNFKALPGCWYKNYQSKRTLESCGFVAEERLLNIHF